MSLQHKSLDQITRADIDSLIANEVPESRTLEYKQALPPPVDEKKTEFCYDVAAFANAAGGDILYGVPEKTAGIPDGPTGIAGLNFDAERGRLEQTAVSRIHPRVPGLQWGTVEGEVGPILILRIPQSWTGPHMVVRDGWVVLYARGDGRNHRLDPHEIKPAFEGGDAIPQKIRAFRNERLAMVVADESPIVVTSKSKLVLHLIPLASVTTPSQYGFTRDNLGNILPPEIGYIGSISYREHRRYNLDGVLVWGQGVEEGPPPRQIFTAYVQFFRNGSVEAVASLNSGMKNHLPQFLGRHLLDCFRQYTETLKRFSVSTPIAVMLSLVGVRGRSLYMNELTLPVLARAGGHNMPFDRDTILLPEVLLEDLTGDIEGEFTPALDSLWQGGGWSQYVKGQ